MTEQTTRDPAILGRALLDKDDALWPLVGEEHSYRCGVITPSYRDRFEAEHGPLREVLLVPPAAARVLDAAREWRRIRADRSTRARAYLDACRTLAAAVDALDDDHPPEPGPDWGVSTAEAEAAVPALGAALRASALDAPADPPESAATPPADPDPGDGTTEAGYTPVDLSRDAARTELADLRESLAGCVWMAPGRMSGDPCVGGTRIPAGIIAGLAADGLSGEEIRTSYPSVSDAGVAAAVAWQQARDTALETLQAVGRRLHEATREPHPYPALLTDEARLLRLVGDLAGERARLADGLATVLARTVELADERDAARRDGAADALDHAAYEYRNSRGADAEDLRGMAAEVRSGARTIPTAGEETDHA